MFILTMVFVMSGMSPMPITSIVVEYSSKERCMMAAEANRFALAKAQVILSTCSQK